MTSPFKTFEEFSEAEGPIYTFANNSSAIAILLLIVAAITLYFLYASYNIKPGESKPQNPVALSLFLIAGVSSLLANSFLSNDAVKERQNTEASRRDARVELSLLAPLGLLGLGATRRQKRRYKNSKREMHPSQTKERVRGGRF